MQFAAAAAERRRIGAGSHHIVTRYSSKPAVTRRRSIGSERCIRNDATRLAPRVTKGDFLKSAAHVFALRHRKTGPEQQRRNDSRLDGFVIDFALDELGQHTRSLRMAD